MKKKTNTAEKNYKTSVKVFAVILPIIAFFAVWIALEEIAYINSSIKYNHYYACEIAGAEAEKQADGSYIITVAIKNTSAYQTTVYKNAITVKYGNGTILDNRMPPYPDTEILRSINEPIIPAGQTIEYKIQILPPEGINTVRLSYHGIVYTRYDLTGEEPESSFTLKLS